MKLQLSDDALTMVLEGRERVFDWAKAAA